MSMFCYQCEQTAKGVACTKTGVCGKDPKTAALQDVLVQVCKGIGAYAHRAEALGVRDPELDSFLTEALFTTLTNVNFDPESLNRYITRAVEMRERAQKLYEKKADPAAERLGEIPTWQPASDLEKRAAQASEVGIERRKASLGDDVTGLQELITYGLKGVAAYTHHARILGKADIALDAAIHQILAFLASEPTDIGALTAKALEVGEINLKAMELLDAANTEAYGHPEPTSVRVEPLKGKAIVVSGHDLKDLDELLKQTDGKGINVYTHGEMLPCHAYPALKKHKHLVGNYGGAWQEQQKEFAAFPGAIVMTTNCLMKPLESYRKRIFTCGPVAYPGVCHISDHDFRPVIEAALAAPGFAQDGPAKTITIGFARNAVMSVAGKVIEAVKSGAVRHFFLIGGCDGAKPGRNYYTELALAVPKDCIILTLACGKYRFNKLNFGEIRGIPRMLDIGQCNDAYSAIQIALALAKAFNTDVNSLPLSIICSWYEQKAVAILLTLLHLGIKRIRLGPSLPAFITPPVLKTLVEKFQISPISTPKEDLKAILG